MPVKKKSRTVPVTNKIAILLRFHDISKLEELSICLLSLAGQIYERVEPVILTQRFTDEQIKMVEDVLDDFSWHEDVNPRVVNLALETPVDLRTHLLNTGLQATKDARYVAVLDYDDFAGQEHYSRLVESLEESDAAISYSGMLVVEQIVSKSYYYTVKRRFIVRNNVRVQDLYNSPQFQMACFALDRTRIAEEDLAFDDSIVYEEDYNFNLRISLKYPSTFAVAAEKVPALVRTVRRDGTNSIVSEFDDKETAAKKIALRSAGRQANAEVRAENYRVEYDPFVMLWVEPFPLRGGTAYNWVVYAMGMGFSEFPKRSDYGHLRVAFSHRYGKLVSSFQETSWAFPQNYETVKEIEKHCPHMRWDDKAIGVWKDLMQGKGLVYEPEKNALKQAHQVFPFQTVLTFGVNGAVHDFAAENGIDHISLELGPTRIPFLETAHCDPFGVNGDSVLSKLPKGFELPPLSTEKDVDTFVARAGRPVPKSPERIRALKRENKKVVLLPLQLADDANFLLHAEQYNTFADFLEATVPPLVAAGWTCVIRPHPFAERGDYTSEDMQLCQSWYDEQSPEDVHWMDEDLTPDEQMGLYKYCDAVVTVNSSVGFEAMLQQTPTVTMGASSYSLEGYHPTFEDLLNGRDLDAFLPLQKRLVAFNLFHHQVPVGDLFSPTLLMRRIEEAKEMKRAYNVGGAEGLADYLIKTPRTRLIDYMTTGKSPMHTSPPSIMMKRRYFKSLPELV